MAAIRRAEVVWQGDLLHGKGEVTAKSSAAFEKLPVTWASRAESADGRTSPEELIAAAHATCFSMALAMEMAGAGAPPERLDVSATVTFDKVADGYRVVSSELEVSGKAAGIDAARFGELAEGARQNCPVSKALAGNVALSVKATLVS